VIVVVVDVVFDTDAAKRKCVRNEFFILAKNSRLDKDVLAEHVAFPAKEVSKCATVIPGDEGPLHKYVALLYK
jgi:hypothetical protein